MMKDLSSKIVVIILAGFLLFGQMSEAFALESQFIISQQVIADDTDAPTVPQNLSAHAVSTDQINLSWDASTDNVGVSGYQVFRDGIQIATSSATTYADIGLVASTTYAYNVTAFDALFQISTSSATTTATTQSVVVAPSSPSTTPRGDIQGTQTIPSLKNLKVTRNRTNVSLSWDTTIPTQSTVSWGVTHEYEIASLEERSRFMTHATNLSGLREGTQYVFRIMARYGPLNKQVVLWEGSFTTLSSPDTEAPENVSVLRARQEGEDVILLWQNPRALDFDHVRIVRKENTYPTDPYDGIVVFEGNATSYRDQDVLRVGNAYGYAVFAYDALGNGSSGAIVKIQKEGTTPLPEESGSSTEDMHSLRFEDIQFFEGGAPISFIGNEVTLQGNAVLMIRIPYTNLPEHLKTILVTLADSHETTQTFSFLLRVNKEKTAYEAVLASLEKEGVYPLSVSLFDYKERTLSKVNGTLRVQNTRTLPEHPGGIMAFLEKFDVSLDQMGYWFIAFLLSLTLLLLSFITHHRTKEKAL